ncbi:Proteasome assembly chaperone 4 [Chionoecetes opilio]|uniref:Proteasome assembly chaperone 4 n=1 Tax=Chionoecetes opilio TaxID=41210 RepID=A0A8J4Y6P0_CHIOP|nr:Proteasome assembly chaperone 4 [Chionoecetes opilio]
MDEITPNTMNIREFQSQEGPITLYYQLLSLAGSVYVWVGTEDAKLGSLVAAFTSRVGPPATSSLLGPVGEGSQRVSSMAQRLQERVRKQVLLSVNVPSDELMVGVEQRLLEELCVA